MKVNNVDKLARIATIGIIVYLLCFGMAMVLFPIRPFWNDEWRLIYNLKFKSVRQLWGTLDLLQQCPRVYLSCLKVITSFFDYSYTSLRFPALIIGIASVFLCFHVKKKIFPNQSVQGSLLILIIISSQTFTDYLVQVKQYEMELFLCLLALWQMLTLLEMSNGERVSRYKYLLLCFTFLAAPFFSYTYPIAVAPVILIIVFNSFTSSEKELTSRLAPVRLYFPLAIVCASIVVFYFVDVKQLMADNRMYLSYIRMLGHEKNESHFVENFWKLFSLVGSGLAFEIIFGIIGIASFFYGIFRLSRKRGSYAIHDYLRLYGILLLILTLSLFLSGKLMGGVARLTAYTLPSIAFLIVSFFDEMKAEYRFTKLANIFTTILFIGLVGNIASTCVNTFTYPEYNNRILTYRNTSKALKDARRSKVPILITDGVRGDKIADTARAPGKIQFNTITVDQIAGADVLCAEVVAKVNPEYKVWDTIPIISIPDMKWVKEYMMQLPPGINSVVAGDGVRYIELHR